MYSMYSIQYISLYYYILPILIDLQVLIQYSTRSVAHTIFFCFLLGVFNLSFVNRILNELVFQNIKICIKIGLIFLSPSMPLLGIYEDAIMGIIFRPQKKLFENRFCMFFFLFFLPSFFYEGRDSRRKNKQFGVHSYRPKIIHILNLYSKQEVFKDTRI